MEHLRSSVLTQRIKREVWIVVAIMSFAMMKIEMFSSGTHGFVIALDVVFYSILLYTYKDIDVKRLTLLTAAVSPLFRMTVIWMSGTKLPDAALTALPDAVFFLTFGMVYYMASEYICGENFDIGAFVMTAFAGDLAGNTAELVVRSALINQSAFSYTIVGFAVFAAAARTVMAYSIIALLDWNTQLQLNVVRLREYRSMLAKSAILKDEIYLMNKNMADVENVMKKGYDLYEEMDREGYPEDTVGKMLEITKLTHEIKGDYRNVINVLNGLYDEDLARDRSSMHEIIHIEEANAKAYISAENIDADIITELSGDFIPEERYKLMSVIRNLLTNSIEAIADSNSCEHGIISLSQRLDETETGEKTCVIGVSDNGPGIPPRKRDKIFMEGYSTKFSHKTGHIQRGLGLPVVRSYIEEDMKGSIEIPDDKAGGAHFRITIPVNNRNELRPEGVSQQ